MPSAESPFLNFPAFQPLFEKAEGVDVPLYLTLLNLRRGCAVAVKMLRGILQEGGFLTPQVVALLSGIDWRPQLVGAVALGAASEAGRAALWQAFDSGSWVSPQLAATVSLVDTDFESHARLRIEVLCPINRERLEGLDWLTRHSAAGPGSFADHSSKALTALIGLCGRCPEADIWLRPLLEQDDIQRSITYDPDDGEQIALSWLDGFVQLWKRLSDSDMEAR